MNKRQRRVFTLLRTKTKAIGLNRKELEGLALKIDKDLELEKDASDEEIDAAIEEAIDAAIPFLEVSQSVAQRSIQNALQRRRANQDTDDNDDDDSNDDDSNDDDSDGDGNGSGKGKGKGKKTPKTPAVDSAIMTLLKEQSDAIKSLNEKFASMQGSQTKDARRAQLKKLLENTGQYGKSVLKQFDFMDFKTDEDFEDYLDGVRDDLDAYNQERADQGLKKLGEVPTGGKDDKGGKGGKIEALSDEDIIALAGGSNNQNK